MGDFTFNCSSVSREIACMIVDFDKMN